MEDKNVFIVIFVIGIVLGFIAGAFVVNGVIEKSAIEHGHAIYHPETGDFTWKERK